MRFARKKKESKSHEQSPEVINRTAVRKSGISDKAPRISNHWGWLGNY